MRTCFLHVTLSASAGTVICERWLSSSIADPSLAWIGRRKTLLAYTMIFAVGAVRYSRSVPPLWAWLIFPGTGIPSNSKW